VLISLLQGLLICVEGGADVLLLLPFVGHSLLHLLYLFQAVNHLGRLSIFALLPCSVHLSLLEFQLLVVFERGRQLTEILPERAVFKCKLIHGCPVLVYVVDNGTVLNVDVQL
jgi:hypothetical protein